MTATAGKKRIRILIELAPFYPDRIEVKNAGSRSVCRPMRIRTTSDSSLCAGTDTTIQLLFWFFFGNPEKSTWRLGILNVTSDTYGIFRQTSFDDSYYNSCVLAPLCFPAPLNPESIEWFIENQAFSPSYDMAPPIQRWAKCPIDRSSDTDSIFRLYRTIQSVDFKFRFLYRPIVSVRLSSDSLIVRSCFLVLSSDFCIMRLCRPVLSKKIAVQAFLGPWLQQNSSFICSWFPKTFNMWTWAYVVCSACVIG